MESKLTPRWANGKNISTINALEIFHQGKRSRSYDLMERFCQVFFNRRSTLSKINQYAFRAYLQQVWPVFTVSLEDEKG